VDLQPGLAKNSEVPEGSFVVAKFAHHGPTTMGDGRTPKHQSQGSLFHGDLGIPGGYS